MNDRVFTEDLIFSTAASENPDPNFAYDLCMLSHVGNVRDENQDYRGFKKIGDKSFIIVCDGMGGHSGGYEASRLATQVMIEYFEQNHTFGAIDILLQSIKKANRVIYDYGRQNPKLQGMGTTVVAGILEGNSLRLAHVGDSRAYLIRKNHVNLLTFDHSQVYALVRKNVMTFEAAEVDENNNVLLCALGVAEELPIPDSQIISSKEMRLSYGDKILLCSDGLYGVPNFYEKLLSEMLAGNVHINAQTAKIMDFATKRVEQGYLADDNVTISLLHYKGTQRDTLLTPDVRDQYRQKNETAKTQILPTETPYKTQPFERIVNATPPPKNKNTLYMAIAGIVFVAIFALFNLLSGDGEEDDTKKSKTSQEPRSESDWDDRDPEEDGPEFNNTTENDKGKEEGKSNGNQNSPSNTTNKGSSKSVAYYRSMAATHVYEICRKEKDRGERRQCSKREIKRQCKDSKKPKPCINDVKEYFKDITEQCDRNVQNYTLGTPNGPITEQCKQSTISSGSSNANNDIKVEVSVNNSNTSSYNARQIASDAQEECKDIARDNNKVGCIKGDIKKSCQNLNLPPDKREPCETDSRIEAGVD